MRSGRPACQAAKAMTQTAAYVRATRVSTADHPKMGGRCKRKNTSTRPKKRSMLVRLPHSSAVHVGGKPSRFLYRLRFQGTIACAPSIWWIHAMSLSPQ